ncbi:MAG TPA: undecaprenyldiphospho-muramoylpentapeptide beta-N-acetylglucosaminyltransferase [Candidatus Methylacidiphilales bacterium]
MALRVLIACGGTGGHLFPGVAVAEELRRRGHEPLLLVSRKEIDKTALAGRGHLPSRALPAVGWPGLSLRLFRFAAQLWQARGACRALFAEVRPDVVLGMGGFTSAVPAWEAKRRRVPSLIHESNAVPGRVTRLMAKWADRTLLGFAACAPHLAPARCEVTGTPVRAELVRLPKDEAARVLGLDPAFAGKTLLVIGGSQGARGVNRLFAAAAPLLAGDGLRFVHQTGKDDEAAVAAAYAKAGVRAVVKAFLDGAGMAAAYSLADLAVARSGASSLTELGHYGLPSILIPFPAAADDHQTANARVFEEAGAARLRPQGALTAEEIAATVRNLLSEAGRTELDAMAKAAAGLSVPDAAARVANEVESCAKK